MIEVQGLTKRFGEVSAVENLSFTVRPGEVTSFLGPNGAGKTTTLRMILGLDTPTAGRVAFDGKTFAQLPAPLRQVGALLDARAVHPSRTAAQHLLVLAHSNGIDPAQVPRALAQVGLEKAATRRSSAFSLGMLQRLGLAAALLGDPPVLVLDEPLNGLDAEGIVWFRGLMRQLAAEGRTVLVSSHLMAEVALTADHLLVIGGGRLLADMSVAEFTEANSVPETLLRTPGAAAFGVQLSVIGASVHTIDDHTIKVTGLDCARIGKLAADSGVELHELSPVRRSLEDAFMALTGDSAEYSASGVPRATPRATPADEFPRGDVADAPAPTRPAAKPAAGPTERTRPRGRAARPLSAPGRPRTERRPSFKDAVRSEWVKLRTTRSGRYLALGTLVAGAGLAALTSNSAGEQYQALPAAGKSAFDPVEISLRGHLLAQLTISLLGAQAITAEYNTGTITSTLTAVPDRARLMAAKALVVGGAALPVGLAATLGGFLGGQAMLARHGAPHARLGDPGALRAVLGGSLYLSTAGLLGLGVGGILRSTSGSATTLFGVTLILPAFSPTLPGKLARWVATYWPTRAGAQIMTVYRDPRLMRPWPGLGVMCAVTGGVLGTACVLFTRRDA